jgi:hypothetical protein
MTAVQPRNTKKKTLCNISGAPGPIPDPRAPVICTGSTPLSHLVGTVRSTMLQSLVGTEILVSYVVKSAICFELSVLL